MSTCLVEMQPNNANSLAHGSCVTVPPIAMQMQAKEIEQQRLQQQVEEKQQACEILAMQLVDAQRRCQHSDGFPVQPAILPEQVSLGAGCIDLVSCSSRYQSLQKQWLFLLHGLFFTALLLHAD